MAYIVIPPDFIPYVSTIVNIVISFTPLFSYGSTVLSIRRNKSSQGFSIDICGTMLVASILRIFYYFNDPFEVTLLRQCFVMVFIQTILLKVALKYRSEDAVHFEEYHGNWGKLYNQFININKEVIEDTLQQYNINDTYNDFQISTILLGIFVLIIRLIKIDIGLIFSLAIEIFKNILRLFDYHYTRPFHYWQWRKSLKFWQFLIGFISILSIIQIIFNGNEYLGIIFGSVSFMIESSLPLPQILLFQRLKHVENFKIILLFSWLGGDITKISYLFYGTENIGFIFVFAAFFQMSLNFIITYLYFYYKFNPGHSISNNGEFQMGYLPIAHTKTNSDNDNKNDNDYDDGGHDNNTITANDNSNSNSTSNNKFNINKDTRVSSDASSSYLYQTPSISSNTTMMSNIVSPLNGLSTMNSNSISEKRSISRASSIGVRNGIFGIKLGYEDNIDSNDGDDLAGDIDISGIIPKLNNNTGVVNNELKGLNGVDSDVDSLNEVVRSRAGTLNTR
ncbi:hypothetical protein C6P40_003228 [Pichia californica]|uniref:Uncharacterized protein n=1 Tax=Pichia californica TaxID=460514 RepID=A0A9P7BHP2_9ASCO|nr:hypothetical protein C6P40_003228 [[Candida] californica]